MRYIIAIGFTAGAAPLIATSRMKHVLGILIPKGESFLHNWIDVFDLSGELDMAAVVIALRTLLSTLLVKNISRAYPTC